MWIVNYDEDNWHEEAADLTRKCGKVVRCFKEKRYIVVYALLAEFFGYGSLVLVRSTAETTCQYEEAERRLKGSENELTDYFHK